MTDRSFWIYAASLVLISLAGASTGMSKGWWFTFIGIIVASVAVHAMIRAKPKPAIPEPIQQIAPPPPVKRPPKTVLVLAQECYCHECMERAAILHLALAARARESIEEQLGGAQ